MNTCRAARLALLVKMPSARHPWPSRFNQHLDMGVHREMTWRTLLDHSNELKADRNSGNSVYEDAA